jgi:hypothetical protein
MSAGGASLQEHFMLVFRGAWVARGRQCAVICGLALLLCAGCGGDGGVRRVAVFGKVTLNGTPVTTGSVSLLPEGDGPPANVTIDQGVYRFDRSNGPAAGPHQILVNYSVAEPVSSKVAAFQSPKPPKQGEFASQVEVPAGKEFEHNIEMK